MLRSEGWTVEKVEQRLPIPGRFVTRDMGGFADLVAWKADHGIAAIQVTSGSNLNARMRKIEGLAAALEWAKSGGSLWVHGWAKRGPRGQVKRWTCRSARALAVQGGLEWIE